MAPGSTPRRVVTLLRWLLAILMLVIGLAIGIPGIKLITLGGSVWFTAMGIVMLMAASFSMRWALSLPSFGQFTMPDGHSGHSSHAYLPSPCWPFWLPCCGLLCARSRR